jgi:hypothetical protein
MSLEDILTLLTENVKIAMNGKGRIEAGWGDHLYGSRLIPTFLFIAPLPKTRLYVLSQCFVLADGYRNCPTLKNYP